MNCGIWKCGCEDTGLHAPCPPTIPCTRPQPCAEVFSNQCIVNPLNEMSYGDLVIAKNEPLYVSMQKIMIMLNSEDPSVAPINFRATSITSTTIGLAWTLQNTGTTMTLDYGTTISMGTSLSITAGTESGELSGLTANTDYYMQLTSDGEKSVIIKVKTLTA